MIALYTPLKQPSSSVMNKEKDRKKGDEATTMLISKIRKFLPDRDLNRLQKKILRP